MNSTHLEKFTVSPTNNEISTHRSHVFDVEIPAGTTRIDITLRFSSANETQLPLAVFDTEKKLRGIGIHEFSSGAVQHILWLAEKEAGRGAVLGPITPGTWCILVYGRHIFEEIQGEVEVTLQHGSFGTSKELDQVLTDTPIKMSTDRYCGEMHMHSLHSTGRTDVETIIRIAREEGLDFIGITDHFTISHWPDIQKCRSDQPPLLLHSYEVSGDKGHANLHGVSKWISPFMDLEEPIAQKLGLVGYTMNDVADQAHQQGGLFCINHPLSGKAGWRYKSFDFSKADLIEVVGLPDGPNSFLYPVLWDRFLCSGYKITGVGSSDSHDPSADGPWKLGVIRNWVKAKNLSESAILSGLKSGNVSITLGNTRLDYTAKVISSDDSPIYEMGDTVFCSFADLIELTVSLSNHPKGNIYIIMDGLIFDTQGVAETTNQDECTNITFSLNGSSLREGINSYIRVEFHEEVAEPFYVNMAWRDHTSIRGLSNPIYLSLMS